MLIIIFIELYRSNINYVKCLFNLKVAFGIKKNVYEESYFSVKCLCCFDCCMGM